MVYEIVKYDLQGATLYTKKERPDLSVREGKNKGEVLFWDEENKREAFRTHLFSYTTNPNKAAYDANERFLPYFADVTEDRPNYVNNPITYKNCQLLTEKHGGYLQFWHEETQQKLRIAINSHYYTPSLNNK